MTHEAQGPLGLSAIVRVLDERYEFDPVGQMIRTRDDGVLPRFVLGRCAEGCIWRSCVGLAPELVIAVSRLAAREPGVAIGGESPSPAPERLVMIERHLGVSGSDGAATREEVVVGGRTVAELWTID